MSLRLINPTCLVLAIVASTIIPFGDAVSSVPQLLNYQGTLLEPNGLPVSDGTYQITFSIYEVPSGTDLPIWTEVQSVSTQGGIFVASLGANTALTEIVFDGVDRYLGIRVGSDNEMTPRIRFVSTPFAFRVETIDGSNGGVVDGSIELSGTVGSDGVRFPDGTLQTTAAYSNGFSLPFSGNISSPNPAVSITNAGDGQAGLFNKSGGGAAALEVTNTAGTAIQAFSPGTGIALLGLGSVIGSAGSSVDGTAGVRGEATNSSGMTRGVHGVTSSSSYGATGVMGDASSTIGEVYGVQGVTSSTEMDASGVKGEATGPEGQTNGVWGVSRSTEGVGVYGTAIPASSADGIAHGVAGETWSSNDLSSGVRGVTVATTGLIYGVSGRTSSSSDNTAGVFGKGHVTGISHGVLGTTSSATNSASGVRGDAESVSGRVYGIYGSSASNTGGTAGVRGDVSATPPPASTQASMGVWGKSLATSRTVAVQGDVIPFDPPPAPLNTQIGVRGYVPDQTSNSIRVGVEGDASPGVTEPLVASGVRGWIQSGLTSNGWSGVVGQALGSGANPSPDIPSGHIGVWGIAQSGNVNSVGVLGDATDVSAQTQGVRGRSKSVSGLAAGVMAEGNGTTSPGNPRAAALEIKNGAIRVTGTTRPAGVASFFVNSWSPQLSGGSGGCPCDHNHIVAYGANVTVVNPLIMDSSIVLLTVEAPSIQGAAVNLADVKQGSADAQVTLMSGFGVGPPPPMTVLIHYLIVNRWP